MEPLLGVQDLAVSYGLPKAAPRLALNGISFEITRGEAVGLLGESGCGKTTLALTLLNLLPPWDYINAARGFGASWAYILRRHVLPDTFAVVLTQAALLIPQYILAEVTLSFLGLGKGEPVPSWGNMLAGLQRYYVL